MVKYISLKVSEELYGLIAKEADSHNVPLIEMVVHILAQYFDREDLDYVPRMRRGRPRADQVRKNGKAELAKAGK